eukprot:m.119551 g.119551  ORF g.119551 m.119551 type:complete len:52 (+) comp14529_c0_seq3:130-285(+)
MCTTLNRPLGEPLLQSPSTKTFPHSLSSSPIFSVFFAATTRVRDTLTVRFE